MWGFKNRRWNLKINSKNILVTSEGHQEMWLRAHFCQSELKCEQQHFGLSEAYECFPYWYQSTLHDSSPVLRFSDDDDDDDDQQKLRRNQLIISWKCYVKNY